MSYMDEAPFPEPFGPLYERPPAEPCPNCECCSARLCVRATMDGQTCMQIAAPEDRRIVARCPCTNRTLRPTS
jgi:hypothetical protein